MRRVLRALKVLIAGGAALTLEAPALISPAAPGDVFDEIVIAHRSGAAAKFGEGTMLSYQDSVANLADILDGDISWTKDGTIIIIHNSTLDRITNCSGEVSDWLWTSIRDNLSLPMSANSRLSALRTWSHTQTRLGGSWPSSSSKRRSRTRKQSSCGIRSSQPTFSWKRHHRGWLVR